MTSAIGLISFVGLLTNTHEGVKLRGGWGGGEGWECTSLVSNIKGLLSEWVPFFGPQLYKRAGTSRVKVYETVRESVTYPA